MVQFYASFLELIIGLEGSKKRENRFTVRFTIHLKLDFMASFSTKTLFKVQLLDCCFMRLDHCVPSKFY